MDINTLSPEQQELFYRYGIGLDIPVPFALIHQAFESFVDCQPDSIAIEYDGSCMTYKQLEESANSLANRLISNDLLPRQRVCLVVQRSFELVIAILAVLKCGCQYVPLDGGVVPDESLAHILRDTAPTVVLCLQKFVTKIAKVADGRVPSIVLDDPALAVMEKCISRPQVSVDSSDGAYLIYTSGTTGFPSEIGFYKKIRFQNANLKLEGVDVSHGNVTNLLCIEPGNLGISKGVKVPQLLSISFDMGQWEILGTLMNGGTLLIRGSDWSVVLKEANTIISTPSILATTVRDDYPNIKVIALAGEPCHVSLADQWSRQCTLYNCCGPTEVTIVNTMQHHVAGEQLTIGRPVPNTRVYILDEQENPVPIGKSGVMWVGGRCVTRGYLNLPEVTAQKYKLDKFSGDGSFMFNTGDVVRWLSNGTLEILGRLDDQVKIKGFRVELNSISSCMKQIDGIQHACAIYHEDILYGFYSGPRKMENSTLASELAMYQPYYSIPRIFKHMEFLPLTTNGKIDKRALVESILLPLYEKLVVISSKAVIKVDVREQYSPSSIATSMHEGSLPPKKGLHGLRALRHRIFSLYRRFLSVAVLANVIAVLITVLFSARGKVLVKLGTAVAGNLTVAVLMRQDHVVNLLFWIACSVPVSAPMWLRRNCAKVYHIGGIHSGCAIAATFWLIIFCVFSSILHTSAGVQVVNYLIVTLLIVITGLAHPTFRAKQHNRFELTHRYAGWSAVALFWIQTILVVDSTRDNESLGIALTKSLPFWLIAISTTSVALPWLKLRKVIVRSDVLSAHAVRLYFEYCTPVVGTAVRLSNNPLVEWHAFATIAKPNEKGFSLLVSNAGDWTSHQIRTAPTQIWIRGVPACGVLRIAPLFKSIVLVATGSGIGPCLPVIYARRVPARIFWSTPNPEKTFGGEIIEAIKAADSDAVIHNTKTMGRPDMVAITYRLLRESNAEAVCVISNKKLTQMIVYAMESRGIPAFGAIFDS